MKEEFETQSCRICLTTTKKLRSLYKPIDEGDEPPNEMLEKITGIQVEELNEHTMLPKNICKNCELSLSMAFEFRMNALKTQQMIVSFLKELMGPETLAENTQTTTHLKFKKDLEEFEMNIQPMEGVAEDLEESLTENALKMQNEEAEEEEEPLAEIETIETESSQEFMLRNKDDNDSDDNYGDYDQENSVGHQYDDEDEHENAEEEEVERIEDDQDDYDEGDLNEMEFRMEFQNLKNETEDKQIFTKPWADISKSFLMAEKKENKKSKKKNQQVEKTKPPSKRGRKPLNSTKNMAHICDVCGNVFAKRSRMMEHRQRHDKELKYSCELCDQKFHMRELLRKHMYLHSGGKPYKCEFCSRTFYYESVKKAHEAVHQGHKPYICDVCGKAFGYAHALKKHKLIHAEIKLYRCDYCNKDFRLQHHMKQHELTKMHQNAVRSAEGGEREGEGDIADCKNTTADSHPEQVDINDDEHYLSDDIILVEEITEEQ